MNRISIVIGLVALFGCGVGSEAPAPEKRAAVKAPPKSADLSMYFAKEGQVDMELVDNHLLGKDFLPGGNLAQYDKGGKKYQQFLIQTRNGETAALLAFEFKGDLADSKFVPHFGGYFGMDGDRPIFLFPKSKYVAGYVGLSQDDADTEARVFAGRIPN